MVNASLLAMEYASSLPKKQTPSHTQGRQGFYHLVDMEGICEDAKLLTFFVITVNKVLLHKNRRWKQLRIR